MKKTLVKMWNPMEYRATHRFRQSGFRVPIPALIEFRATPLPNHAVRVGAAHGGLGRLDTARPTQR
jgi:hypothetical protein